MPANISPYVYAASVFGTALATVLAFLHWHIPTDYFFASLFGLAVVYGLINLFRQGRGLSEFHLERAPDWPRLLRRAAARYLVWLPIVYLAGQLYGALPYAPSGMLPVLQFFDWLLRVYLVLGLPYFVLTLLCKASRSEDFYDPAVRLLHIARQALSALRPGGGRRFVKRVLGKRYNRKVLLNLLMRGYFIPIMVSQVYFNLERTLGLARGDSSLYTLAAVLAGITSFLWLLDTLNASVAYVMESRWLENRSRSLDLTFTGWAVCLFCYYPLNQVTDSLFPFAYQVVNDNPASLVIPDPSLMLAVQLLQVGLMLLHIFVDLSIGVSVANISLKRLQTRGPYAIVRHPGTTTKLAFWLVISAFYSAFWSWPIVLGQLAWSTLYVLRALTEERHLRQHAEYRAYMEQVRYRFIPGVV